MPSLDADTLAPQVARIFTVGLGRYPRRGGNIDQLLLVARELSEDRTYPDVRVIEEAILKSITRLGGGELAELAQLELRLATSTRDLRYLSQRQQKACEVLHIGESALKRREKELHRAIANDLLVRLDKPQPSKRNDRRRSGADVLSSQP